MVMLRRSYLFYVLLFLVLAVVSYYRLNLWQNHLWDGGNLLSLAWRSSLGEVPNLDFRSGYPGAFELLIGFLFRAFGSQYLVYSVFMALVLTATAMGVALAVKTWHGPLVASALGWATYMVSSRYLSLEPGTVVQIVFLICFLCLVRGRRSLFLPALMGAAFWFKQTAVLGCVAYLLVLSVEHLGSNRRGEAMIYRGLVLSPHLVLLGLYFLVRHSSSPSFQNALVLLPWTFAIVVPLIHGVPRTSEETDESLVRHIVSLFINGIAFLGAALSGLALYILWSDRWPEAFREIFLVVPRLIDSLSEGAGFRTKHLLLGALVLGLAVSATRVSSLREKLKSSPFLQVLILFGFVSFAVDHPLFWICFVMPALLLFFWNQTEGQPWRSAVIFVFPTLGLMFPYPSMEHVGILVLLASTVMFCLVPSSRLLTAAFYFGLGFATYKFARHVDSSKLVALEDPLSRAPNLRVHLNDQSYFKAARVVADLIPADEKVGFYPDLALLSYLSGRRPGTFLGNYYANRTTDFEHFIEQVGQLNWFIVNEKYDDDPTHPYIPTRDVMSRLPSFREIARVGSIAIFRR